MRSDLCFSQWCVVDRDLVNRAGEVRGARGVWPTIEVVTTHTPEAVVALCRGNRRIVANTFAINVELHAIGAKVRHDVVVVAVVVALCTGDSLD